MIRSILFVLICCLSLSSCKSDAAQQADSKSTSSSKGTSQPSPTANANDSNKSPQLKSIESVVRKTLGGIMVKSMDFKDGTLSLEYYKSSDEYKSVIQNPRMNEEVFKKYWSTAARVEKVVAIVPSQILNELSEVENVDLTIYANEKTITTNLNRDKLAHFVGQSWKEIQTDWHNLYRFVVVNDSKKRKEFYDKFATVE